MSELLYLCVSSLLFCCLAHASLSSLLSSSLPIPLLSLSPKSCYSVTAWIFPNQQDPNKVNLGISSNSVVDLGPLSTLQSKVGLEQDSSIYASLSYWPEKPGVDAFQVLGPKDTDPTQFQPLVGVIGAAALSGLNSTTDSNSFSATAGHVYLVRGTNNPVTNVWTDTNLVVKILVIKVSPVVLRWGVMYVNEPNEYFPNAPNTVNHVNDVTFPGPGPGPPNNDGYATVSDVDGARAVGVAGLVFGLFGFLLGLVVANKVYRKSNDAEGADAPLVYTS
jgi:hypothetical protein